MSAYLLAKIRGKLSRMVREEDIEALAGADRETLMQRLQSSTYGASLEEGGTLERISDRLRHGFFADVANLLPALTNDDKVLVLDILARYRVENLKTILRAQLRHIPTDEVKPHLFSLPWEHVDYQRLLDAPGIEALIQAVPWPEYRIRLDAVHRQVGDKQELFPYESDIDATYLGRLIRHCPKVAADVGPILKNRVIKELLAWTFRLKHYGYSFPEMVNILPDFRSLIPHEELRHIVEDADGWHAIARFLGSDLAHELDHMDKFELDAVETLFDRRFLRLTQQTFIASPFGIGVVVGYVYLKELELAQLIELTEHVRTSTGGK